MRILKSLYLDIYNTLSKFLTFSGLMKVKYDIYFSWLEYSSASVHLIKIKTCFRGFKFILVFVKRF